MSHAQKITYYVSLVLVSIMFLYSGIDKLLGDMVAVAGFQAIGMPVWFMYVIGAGEVMGAIGLWMRSTFRYAYEGLFLILAGAIVTTAVFMSAALALIPLVVAVILGTAVWLHAKQHPSAHAA